MISGVDMVNRWCIVIGIIKLMIQQQHSKKYYHENSKHILRSKAKRSSLHR